MGRGPPESGELFSFTWAGGPHPCTSSTRRPDCLHQVPKGGVSCIWSRCSGPRRRWDGWGVVAPGRGVECGVRGRSIPTWESVVSLCQSCLTPGGLNHRHAFWLGYSLKPRGGKGHTPSRGPPEEAPSCLRLLHSADMCGSACSPPGLCSFSPKPQVPHHGSSSLILTADQVGQPGPHLPFSDSPTSAFLSYYPEPSVYPWFQEIPGHSCFFARATPSELTCPLLHILQSPTQSTLPCHASP